MEFLEMVEQVLGLKVGSAFDRLAEQVSPLYADGLRRFLTKSPVERVQLIDVRVLAAQWKIEYRKTIGILLHAARQGLVDFRFESYCPLCKSHHESGKRNLQDVHQKGSCPQCRVSYNNGLDVNMVVYFSVNSSVRMIAPPSPQKLNPLASVPALDVINSPEFRLLFGSNVLAPGKSLAIGNLTILFTDVADSTATFSRRGDLDAFNLVREHFDILFEIVRKHNGAVVKTIGDAVMAAFQQPADAVRCAMEAREAFDEFNKLERVNGDSYIKIGIHGGSCVAVTLNKLLDYFGTSVNMAARVQGLAGKQEIIISSVIAQDQSVRNLFQEKRILPKLRQATLKGIPGQQTVFEI